jgi:hypothetical protein
MFAYQINQGPQSSRFSGLFGVGYTWFVSGRWGIVTGFEASLYRDDYKHDTSGSITMSEGYEVPISELGPFRFEFGHTNYSEKHSAFFLQIPVMAQFQTGRFFASAGLKFGIPINAKYEASCTNLTTKGSSNGIEFPQNKDKGFYDFGAMSYSGNLRIASYQVAAAFEAGGQWFLGKRTNLYAGVWLDSSLTNLSIGTGGNEKEHLVEYDPNVPGCLNYYSIMDANNFLGAWSAGLKLKLSFSL